MRIARYVPQLTVAEFDRFHLSPADTCDLAAIDISTERNAKEARRLLANLTDKGHLPCEKSGSGRTSPNLYSLRSAIMLRCFHDLITPANRRTYEFGSPIVGVVAKLAETIISDSRDIDDLDSKDGFTWFVAYSDYRSPGLIHREDFTPEIVAGSGDNGIYSASEMIWHILRRYPDAWARDRIARGVDAPAGRYDGCDADGWPLDPAHPSNLGLPPLERARRLVEIEEFIAARDRKGEADG